MARRQQPRRSSAAAVALGLAVACLAPGHAFLLPSSSVSRPAGAGAATARAAAASSSVQPGTGSVKIDPKAPAKDVRLTFLESNSWLWQAAGLNLLVDPVMYTLDFGVPALIQGKKKVLDGQAALRAIAPSVDYLLISQGFDDHCQPASMAEAARLMPRDAKVVAPPSAAGVLEKYFAPDRITYLSPGQSTQLVGRGDGKARIKVTATTGDTLGPPWQAPENGYVLEFVGAAGGSKYKSLYYEPHCRYDVEEFARLGLSADIVVTPVIEQLILGAYPLVSGQRKAAELAKALKAKVVVPMNNGDIDLGGSRLPLDKMIKKGGTMGEFTRLLGDIYPSAAIRETPAGVGVTV